jgi:hypothetical protein
VRQLIWYDCYCSIGEIAYPLGFTLQHAVMEGIAFLLMNKVHSMQF